MSGARLFEALTMIDAELKARGVHALSPFWRREAQRFYLHPTAREQTACVGRGGVKSGMIVKSAIAETLFSAAVVPPGERHYFAIVSENVTEAVKTATIAEKYFGLLGVPTRRDGDTIELVEAPRGIRVLACRVGAVSGFRCYGWAADECAKWRDSQTGANPAAEVISSIRAMTVTHGREARGRMFSSPLGKLGTFYDSFARGDTSSSVVSHAATWVANPSVTEQQTRELEPDERVWRREYAAIPQAGALAAFDLAAVEAAFRAEAPSSTPRLFIDASSGKKDRFTWAIGGWVKQPDKRSAVLVLDTVEAVEANFWGKVSGADVVARIAARAKARGVRDVHADQRESMMLEAEFRRHGLAFHVHVWTSVSKPAAVERVRRWLADRLVAMPEHAAMREELLSFEERITSTGAFTFGARGTGHDDYVALLLTSAMADLELKLSAGEGINYCAGPTTRGRRRTDPFANFGVPPHERRGRQRGY